MCVCIAGHAPPPSLVPVAPSRTGPVLSVAEAVVDSSRW